jgi:hypothetical protein
MEKIHSAISERSITGEIATALSNPARLAEIQSLLDKTYGPSAAGREVVAFLISHIKDSLVFALSGVFLIGAIMALIGFTINLFVQETKLRSH